MRPAWRRSRATALAAAAALAPALAPSPARALPPPPSAEFFGISPATKLSASEVESIAGSGAGTIRTPFFWPSIEPQAPAEEGGGGPLPVPSPVPEPPAESKHWKATDELVGKAASNGVTVMPFVYGTPAWLSADPLRPPLDGAEARAAWQDLLADLVGRYGPGGGFWAENPDLPETPIETWQIWNEVNSARYWSPAPNAAEYADLLALSSSAIRGADPGAEVVLAGMFGTPANGVHAWTYLESLYATPGVAESFDAYALHPYAPGLKGIRTQVELARDVLAAHGEKRLPLVVSEIGWPTQGPASYNLVKTLGAQKRLLAKSFKLFVKQQRRWKVDRVIWYTWRDNDVQPDCSVCSYSGLFTASAEPKPAWRKFAQLAGGRP